MSDQTAEEKEILEAYHAGDLTPVQLSAAEVAAYREAARGVSRKDQRINIRLSKGDLEALKIRAIEEGMPYQTLISSVLHQFVTRKLERR